MLEIQKERVPFEVVAFRAQPKSIWYDKCTGKKSALINIYPTKVQQ